MQNNSGLRPLGRAVLVLPLEASPEFKSAVGLIIPQAAKERLMMAEQVARVIAVGPEAWKEESIPRASVGQRVMISKYAGTLVVGPLDKKQYRVVNANDIFLEVSEGEESIGETIDDKAAA